MTTARAVDLQDLDATLQRELTEAERRVDGLRHRREQLERELEAARTAEEHAEQALNALRAIATQAGVLAVNPEMSTSNLPALAGSELRGTITRVALRRNAHGRSVHWRTWLGWLNEEGFEAAGKRPEATFLTQLGRSPLVRRTDQDGVYVLDVDLLQCRRDEVIELHRQLAELPPPDQLALIGDVRSERRELQQRIARAERALEEAWQTLTEELDEDVAGPTQLLELWRARTPHDA